MRTLEIRKTIAKDFVEYNDVYSKLDYSRNLIGEEEIVSSPEEYPMSESEFLTRIQTQICYSLFENERLIGFIEIIPIKQEWHIDHFGIVKDRQHQGFGKYFFDRLQELAKENNLETLTLCCFSRGSKVFWEKQGFLEYKQDYYKKSLI